jgi:hypothetical protein
MVACALALPQCIPAHQHPCLHPAPLPVPTALPAPAMHQSAYFGATGRVNTGAGVLGFQGFLKGFKIWVESYKPLPFKIWVESYKPKNPTLGPRGGWAQVRCQGHMQGRMRGT